MSTFLGVLPHLSPTGWGSLADLLYPCPPMGRLGGLRQLVPGQEGEDKGENEREQEGGVNGEWE